jgi:hypothetical protein
MPPSTVTSRYTPNTKTKESFTTHSHHIPHAAQTSSNAKQQAGEAEYTIQYLTLPQEINNISSQSNERKSQLTTDHQPQMYPASQSSRPNLQLEHYSPLERWATQKSAEDPWSSFVCISRGLQGEGDEILEGETDIVGDADSLGELDILESREDGRFRYDHATS